MAWLDNNKLNIFDIRSQTTRAVDLDSGLRGTSLAIDGGKIFIVGDGSDKRCYEWQEGTIRQLPAMEEGKT